jgi:hypothetical protein
VYAEQTTLEWPESVAALHDIPDTWTREGARLIVLRDDGATRVEFSR